MNIIYTSVLDSNLYPTNVVVFQYAESPAIEWRIIDTDGNAIDLCGLSTKFVAFRDNGLISFEIDDSNGLTLGCEDEYASTPDNAVILNYTQEHTSSNDVLRYALWDTTNNRLLARGILTIAQMRYDC